MTDLVSLPPRDPTPTSPQGNFAQEGFENLEPVVVGIGIALVAFYRWFDEAARNAQEKHLRAERLAAYRVRQNWKASDIRPLLTIGVSEPAQRRLAALNGRGRPIVKPHRPLEDVLRGKMTGWWALLREDTTPSERRRSFRAWPWWKHHVEALYRGELNQARGNRVKGPHDHAESIVADALRMSQGMIHMICGEIRAQRSKNPGPADFPPMLLADYEDWMERGVFPRALSG